MEYIAHRAHKYIQKVKTKSGKWRYIYSRPHGRTTGSSSGQAEVHGRDTAFDEYQKWEAQDLARRDQAKRDQAKRDQARKIASQVSTEGRRKEQMAERKFYKKTEVADKALAKLRSFGILGQIVEPFVKKWAKMKVSSLIGKQKS